MTTLAANSQANINSLFDAAQAQDSQTSSQPASQQDTKQLAKTLKKQMGAVRLAKSRWQLTRRLERPQVQKVANEFQADIRAIGASKKLIDPRAPKYRACCRIINEARTYWKSVTIPFPEDGIRLIRRDRMAKFAETMQQFKTSLVAAASELQAAYADIRVDAATRLGELFNSADYPDDITGLFDIQWDFPPVEPPNYLLEADPTGKLYQQQVDLMEARFQEAIAMTEDAFLKAFRDMVQHLADRLQWGEPDQETGERKPLVFRDSAVENLQAFFEQFKALNVGSNHDLEKLVEQAQQIVGDKTAADFRKDLTERQAVQQGMAQITAKLDQMMVARPTRQMSFVSDDEE